jgi:hypothetical protein
MPLTFGSEKDRLNHPLASLIPFPVWEDKFKSQFTEDQLALLSITTSQLVLQDSMNLANIICVFIAHRQMTDRELFICLNRSSITTDILMLSRVLEGLIIVQRNQLALGLTGILSVIDNNVTQPSYQELISLVPIKQDADEKILLLGLKTAIKSNNVAFIASLFKLLDINLKQSLISNEDYKLVWDSGVTYYGYLGILELVLEHCQSDKIPEMLQARHQQIYLQALKKKHRNIMYRLLEVGGKANFDDQDLRRLHETLFFVAKTGDLKLFDKLYQLYPDYQLAQLMRQERWFVFTLAAENGQLAFMEKLRNTYLAHRYCMNNLAAFVSAAYYGQLAVINQLVAWAPQSVQEMLASDYDAFPDFRQPYQAIRRAVGNGHIAIVKRLLELSTDAVTMIISNDYGLFYCGQKHEKQYVEINRLLLLKLAKHKEHLCHAANILIGLSERSSAEMREALLQMIEDLPFCATMNNVVIHIDDLPNYLCLYVKERLLPANLVGFLSSDTQSIAVNINEAKLMKIIESLEKIGTPLAHLVCGLLLEGRLETLLPERYQDNTDSDDYKQYVKKRAHDAVTFYSKAAEARDLKSIASHLLWHSRMFSSGSLRNRLYLLDNLRPIPQVFPARHLFNKYESVTTYAGFFATHYDISTNEQRLPVVKNTNRKVLRSVYLTLTNFGLN